MSVAYRISAFNRMRKWNLFLKEISPTEKMRVLGVGFTENGYSETDNFIEKHYPYPKMLIALSIDTPKDFNKRYPKVTTFHYDGNVFPFEDKAFEICWSNAVIEHVGNLEKQLFFLKEIMRVCKKAFITTPNRFFPVEPHTHIPFLHYLLKKVLINSLL